MSLSRRITAEAIGSAMLLSAVVGSGIMGERLAGGNVAVAVLPNTVATGAALVSNWKAREDEYSSSLVFSLPR